MELYSELINKLIQKEYSVTAAESCTAGLFCARLADVPGASAVLKYGFVVYSEEAKTKVLGVSPETIIKYGVVSEPTAREMVTGAVNKSRADVGVSFTGYAGPGGDDPSVGRVCFGYCLHGKVQTETVGFGNIGRNRVREASAAHAAQRLIQLLEEEA